MTKHPESGLPLIIEWHRAGNPDRVVNLFVSSAALLVVGSGLLGVIGSGALATMNAWIISLATTLALGSAV